jgi:hypothetical protein
MAEVIPMFSMFLGFDYEENPALVGETTLRVADSTKRVKDLWMLFDGILAKHGITYQEKKGKLVFTQRAQKAD